MRVIASKAGNWIDSGRSIRSAKSNASTWLDFTQYNVSIPKDQLPLVVKLESERRSRLVLRDQGFNARIDGWALCQGTPCAFNEFDEGFDALAGFGLERGGHGGVFHRGEDGTFAFMARAKQSFHRHIAQAARGHVRDAQQIDVVVRIDKCFQVGEKIFDFAPVKKTLSADQMITHTCRAQRGFERTRLLVRAKENRLFLPWHAAGHARIFNLFHDRFRLGFVIGKGVQDDFGALAFLRPQLLAATPRIVSATPPVKATPPGEEAAPGSTENSLGMKFAPVGDIEFCVWPVRVRDFEVFAKETGFRNAAWRSPGFKQGPDHPVVNVSWNDAIAFCKWLTAREQKNGLLAKGQEYRLPTDLEKGAIFHSNPDDMLLHCDFLSINAPMTAATRKWVNAERIGSTAKLGKGDLLQVGGTVFEVAR